MKTRLFPAHLWKLIALLGLACLLAACSAGNAKSGSKPTPAIKNAVADGGIKIDPSICLRYGTSDAPYKQTTFDGNTPALWYDGNGGPALQTVYNLCARTIQLYWSTNITDVTYYEVFWFNLHSSIVPPPTYDVHVSGLSATYTRTSVNSGGLYAFSVRPCRVGAYFTSCWPWSPTVLMAT